MINTQDYTIVEEAIRLVQEGLTVILPAKGSSMLPFIIGGKESVELASPKSCTIGQIALAWVDNRRYVIHRIIDIKGNEVTLMGDGNIRGKELCVIGDIKAVITSIVDAEGNHHNPYSLWRKMGARCWFVFLPIRRYLLAIYRRL